MNDRLLNDDTKFICSYCGAENPFKQGNCIKCRKYFITFPDDEIKSNTSTPKEKINCPSCNDIQNPHAKFCKSCGTEINPEKKVTKSVCKQCGEQYDPSYSFCEKDGTKLIKKQVDINSTNQKDNISYSTIHNQVHTSKKGNISGKTPTQVHVESSGKVFKIFENPAGKIEAVKQGWSWTGFFFTWIWCIYKDLFGYLAVIVALGLVSGIILMEVVVEGEEFIYLFLNLIIQFWIGAFGNKDYENNLLDHGYKYNTTLQASSPESAIFKYNQLSNTE